MESVRRPDKRSVIRQSHYAQGYAIGKPMPSLLESDLLLHLVPVPSRTA